MGGTGTNTEAGETKGKQMMMGGDMGVSQRQEEGENREENSDLAFAAVSGEDKLILSSEKVNSLDILFPSFTKSISEIIKVFN